MQGDIAWYVFHLIGYMLKSCGSCDLKEAIAMAADAINVVFDAHNKVVRDIQAGERAYYYVNTGDPYMSDNQCVLLGMLREDTIYKRIDSRLLINMGIYQVDVALNSR
jgi:hypothetical protein